MEGVKTAKIIQELIVLVKFVDQIHVPTQLKSY
jgi:hypothetical protein